MLFYDQNMLRYFGKYFSENHGLLCQLFAISKTKLSPNLYDFAFVGNRKRQILDRAHFSGVQFFLHGGHFSIQFGTVSIQVSVTSLVITITQFIPFLIGCPAILFYIGTGFEVTWGPSRNPNLFSTREKLCKVTKIGCSFSMRHLGALCQSSFGIIGYYRVH